jgi:imidazolonepropionase-like amidohydrolase
MTRTVFRGGSVFDGTGADPAPADVVIEDGRIVDVGTGLDADDAVELAGKTLLPGLFDCHVHVTTSHVDVWKLANTPFSYRFYGAERNLGLTLRAGITSVRDASGADLGIQQALRDGLIEGPRMQISIAMLSQTGGHADDWLVSGVHLPLTPPYPGLPSGIVDGPDEVRRKVRELHRDGANVIKVATSGGVLSPRDNPAHAHFSPEELDVLVAEATAAGMYVMAHAQGADGIKNAVRAGIRSIEHGIFLDAEAIDLMLARGTWLVPTLVAPQGVIDAAAAGVVFPPGVLEKATSLIDVHRRNVGTAMAAGVRVAMGTDAGVTPHGRNLRELVLMHDLGMTPAAVLEATTRSAAQLMGVDGDLGTIERGKIADLVVVDGDPYELATLPDRIKAVWFDGRRIDPRRETRPD